MNTYEAFRTTSNVTAGFGIGLAFGHLDSPSAWLVLAGGAVMLCLLIAEAVGQRQ